MSAPNGWLPDATGTAPNNGYNYTAKAAAFLIVKTAKRYGPTVIQALRTMR